MRGMSVAKFGMSVHVKGLVWLSERMAVAK
jgi:hypothetical protein